MERFNRGIIAANASALGFGRALTFASTAFLGGAGLGALIRAGVSEFSEMTRVAATTNAILKATGGAANIGAAGIDRLAKQQELLTGTDDELVKQAENVLLSFRRIRNEVGPGNDIFTRATKAASDLAAVFGQDVPSAARQLGRALADPARGVVLLRRAGVVFTQDQIKLIKALVDTGQTLKAQRLVLGQVEGAVGGTAVAIGQTLPGKLNILRERARDALGDYVRRLSESREAAELAADGARGLGQAFTVVEGTVRTIGPPLISAAKGATALSEAVGGVGPIIAAVAAYKAVGIAAGIGASAQAAYARSVQIATASTAAETAVIGANTAALRAQAAAGALGALGVNTPLRGAGAASAAIEAERVGASLTRVGIAGRAAAAGIGAGRLALAAVGGPIGAVAIGAAGLTLGILALRRQSENAAGSFNAMRRSLQGLSQAFNQAQDLRTQLAGREENVSLGNFNVLAAQRALVQAQRAAARSTAAPGSLEAHALLEGVTKAEQDLAKAERDLAAAQQNRDRTEEALALNQRQRQAQIEQTTAALEKQIAAFIRGSHVTRVFGVPVGFNPLRQFDTHGLDDFLDRMNKIAASGDPIQQRVGGALAAIATTLNRLPSQKVISIVVRKAGQGGSINDIVRDVLGIETSTEQVRLRGLNTVVSTSAALEQEFQAAKRALGAEREKLRTLKDVVAKRRDELQTARDAVATARESLTAARQARAEALVGLQSARQALVDSQTALADSVRSARQSVNQAVRDAKSNLDALGQSIADMLGKVTGGIAGTGGAVGAQFRALRDEILGAGGGADAQRIRQQIASRAERAPTAAAASKLPQQFADLTDQLDRGKISLPRFNRELNALLRGLNIRAFQREFGTAAANQLREQIAALRTQARLIATGPQRAGGGFQATIVRPLQAVASGNRQIVEAQRAVRSATRDVANAQANVARTTREIGQAQRRLQEAQVKEERKHTIELRAIRKAVEQVARVQTAENKLTKPKPKGNADKTAGDLTNSGAQTP